MALYKRALRTFDTSTLSASYQDVGAVIDFPVSKIAITNTSSVGVLLTDGSGEDDFEIPGGGTLSIGEGLSQDKGTSTKYVFSANTQLQAKQVTASGAGKLIINALG